LTAGKAESQVETRPSRGQIFGDFCETSLRMNKKPLSDSAAKSRLKLTREERLAEVLRANLKRRKDAGRIRKGAGDNDAPGSGEGDD
jgi:hypothetical protein